jgi:hypothetical protein
MHPKSSNLNRLTFSSWPHAGIYPNVNNEVNDIWYAFEWREVGSSKKWQHCICYAKDNRGTMLGNYEVGLNKRFMITWDEHHQKKWRHFLTGKGTWIKGNAMKGRRHQRATLLQTCKIQIPSIHSPTAPNDKAIGPPTNVIHTVGDFSGAGLAISSNGSKQKVAEACYPGTKNPALLL